MARCAVLGALGLGMLVGRAMGHMNSEVNIARTSRRLLQNLTAASESESVNSKWQCEANEVGVGAAVPVIYSSSNSSAVSLYAHTDSSRSQGTDHGRYRKIDAPP